MRLRSGHGLLCLLAAAALLAGCGGGSSKKTGTTATQTTATTTGTTTTPTAKKPKTGCGAKGINARLGKEGTCIRGGKKFTVVNHDTTLRLTGVDIRFKHTLVRTTLTGPSGKAVAGKKGKYVLIKLTVKNTGSKPFKFDAKQKDIRLRVSGNGFREVYKAETAADGSFVSQNHSVKKGSKQTGTIVFLVPEKSLRYLHTRAADPQLLIWQPGTGGGKIGPDGAIRLWK